MLQEKITIPRGVYVYCPISKTHTITFVQTHREAPYSLTACSVVELLKLVDEFFSPIGRADTFPTLTEYLRAYESSLEETCPTFSVKEAA